MCVHVWYACTCVCVCLRGVLALANRVHTPRFVCSLELGPQLPGTFSFLAQG